jgi:hypothetical protein
MDLDEVFSNKDSIADAVSEKLTERMREFGYSILQALVVNVEPDGKVKASMNAMETARRMRVASETKANADHFVVVKKAEADAESKALQGQGIARQRAAICQGLKDSIGTLTFIFTFPLTFTLTLHPAMCADVSSYHSPRFCSVLWVWAFACTVLHRFNSSLFWGLDPFCGLSTLKAWGQVRGFGYGS